MSPLKRFYGPARQRGAIGLMAAVTFGLALLLMLLVVDSGRLYMEQRKLQRVADNAALEAVSRGGTCQAGLTAAAYAGQNATRNGFTVATGSSLSTSCGSLTTGANGLRTFTANPAQAVAIRVIATHTVPISVASGVAALFTPGPINLTTQLSATAVAAAPTPTVAQLSIRSTLGTVSTAQSSILNPLVGGMLGGSLSLSAVGWNGLLNTNINLLSYLNQLAINLGVAAGNYTQLLNTTTSVTQLIQAAITVVQANGATADILTALGNLQVAAINAAPLKLGDILQLQTGLPSTALDANLQLFQLLQAVIQLSNSNSAVAATLPINVLGLANIHGAGQGHRAAAVVGHRQSGAGQGRSHGRQPDLCAHCAGTDPGAGQSVPAAGFRVEHRGGQPGGAADPGVEQPAEPEPGGDPGFGVMPAGGGVRTAIPGHRLLIGDRPEPGRGGRDCLCHRLQLPGEQQRDQEPDRPCRQFHRRLEGRPDRPGQCLFVCRRARGEAVAAGGPGHTHLLPVPGPCLLYTSPSPRDS